MAESSLSCAFLRQELFLAAFLSIFFFLDLGGIEAFK